MKNLLNNFFNKIYRWLLNLLFNKKPKYEPAKFMLFGAAMCMKCGTKLQHKDNGLVVIEYDWTYGGSIGAGIHISGHGSTEYQFHYNRCPFGCNEGWEMLEYRETPSWWDDLWDLDCPFTSGNIIEKYKKGEIPGRKFTGFTITR